MLDPISPSLPPSSSPEYTLSSDSVPPSISSAGISIKEEQLGEAENSLRQQYDDNGESRQATPTSFDAASVITIDSSIDREQVYADNEDYFPGETSEDITEEEMQAYNPYKLHDFTDDDRADDSDSTMTTTDSGHLGDFDSNTSTTDQSTDMNVSSNEDEQESSDEEELEVFISAWFEEILCMELDPPEDLLWWCVVCERQFVLPVDVVDHTRERHGIHLPTPRPVGRPPIDMYLVSTASTQV